VLTRRSKERRHHTKSRLSRRLFVYGEWFLMDKSRPGPMDTDSFRSYTSDLINDVSVPRKAQMRYQGKLTSWKDDQGFGFITPNGGGERVFVHIKAFSSTRRRPDQNEIVTYELTTDKKRRPRAENVAFVGKRSVEARSSGIGWGPVSFAALFLVFVLGAVVAGKLPSAVLALYSGVSVVAFAIYARDKSAAQKSRWRTGESTLHFLGLIGGWPGALLAQKVLRHKSRKQSFQIVFRITVVLNCGALFAYASPAVLRVAHSFL
jgi:uncharacterized membrane protein YsdA (DUF1294 family)/cold shock CspA family protein